ncbi:uncharacterized protein LOC116604649 [Nematostella vectensis]|uniref:uncharacterized protein LOC116604649 n=1 Tax=Nematostella vectensis TaxID=45351 RepID=UPI0020773AA6|nr:uncharacterized protein LOC116604649 [Nematostella vectensis]
MSRILFFLIMTTTTENIKSSSIDLHNVYFEIKENQAVPDQSLTEIEVRDDVECISACTKHEECFVASQHKDTGRRSTCRIYGYNIFRAYKSGMGLVSDKHSRVFRVIDPCSKTPCQNGGSCTSKGDSYTCTCPNTHVGRTCQAAILQHWLLDGTDSGLTSIGALLRRGRKPGTTAISFSLKGQHALVPEVELRGRSFSIACWVKVTTQSLFQVIYGDWYPPYQFVFFYYGGKLAFQRHSSLGVAWYHYEGAPDSFPVAAWCHVAVSWDQSRGTVKLFVDAVLVGSSVFDINMTWHPPSGHEYMIGDDGRIGSNNQFFGSMMDLYIIAGALHQHDVEKLRGD